MKSSLKILSSCLIISSLAAMTACGGSSSTNSTANPAPSPSANEASPSLESFEISISNFMPDKHILNQAVMMPLAEQLTQKTNDRIKASVFPGGALGKAPDHFNMAAAGVADIAILIHGYTPGKFPVTQIGEMPFIVPYDGVSSESATRVLWDIKEKYPQIVEEHAGTKILALFTADPAVFMMKDKELKSLEDLKGLKIRTPSAAANGVIESLGAIPVSMPMPDVYDAMHKGVIDGALGVVSALHQFKLAEVTKYVLNAKVYGTTFALVMNENSYNKFKGEDKKLLDSLIGKELSLTAAKGFDKEALDSFELAKSKGITVRDLGEDEVKQLQEKIKGVTENWINAMEEKGVPAKEMHEEALRLGLEYAKK